MGFQLETNVICPRSRSNTETVINWVSLQCMMDVWMEIFHFNFGCSLYCSFQIISNIQWFKSCTKESCSFRYFNLAKCILYLFIYRNTAGIVIAVLVVIIVVVGLGCLGMKYYQQQQRKSRQSGHVVSVTHTNGSGKDLFA